MKDTKTSKSYDINEVASIILKKLLTTGCDWEYNPFGKDETTSTMSNQLSR